MADSRIFTALIEPAELHEIHTSASTVVFDVRFSLADPEEGLRLYAESHIPGAHYLHLDENLSGDVTPRTGRHPLPEPTSFADSLGRCGVGKETQVVAYDQGSGAFAARLWWLCKWLGHDRTAVLHGGFAAWQAQGHPVDHDLPLNRRGDFQARLCPDLLVTTGELEQRLRRGDIHLVDARAPERFRGEVEPIDRVAGHIPGAVNVPFTGNLGEEGRFLPADRLAERHTQGENVVHMCGSGVTACHNILATLLAGHPMPRLYAGSWSEWIADPNRPIATGEAID